MLIEYSVANYKSIKERQTLSLAAKKYGEHSFSTGYAKAPYLLQRIAILGPNASGKSNIIDSMFAARQIIRKSYKFEHDEQISVESYALDDATSKMPCEFEFIFTLNDAIYQYGFAADTTEIHAEWLYVTPKQGKLQKWIERTANTDKKHWHINAKVKGRRKEWIEETRPNTLLLSLLGTYKNHDLLKEIQRYITHGVQILSLTGHVPTFFTAHACFEDNAVKDMVAGFLQSADLGLHDFTIQEKPFSSDSLPANLAQEDKEKASNALEGKKILKTTTLHKKEDGTFVEFDLHSESEGTQLLYSLAYPILETLRTGEVLVVDEINRSIHFKELEFIEDLFKNPKTNPHGAQLIFTTHDISTLHRLHREEIYFTDKVNGFHTQLYPLTDFENRGDVSTYNRYMHGTYFALPKIMVDR